MLSASRSQALLPHLVIGSKRTKALWRFGLCVKVLYCGLGDVSLKGIKIMVQMFLSHTSKI